MTAGVGEWRRIGFGLITLAVSIAACAAPRTNEASGSGTPALATSGGDAASFQEELPLSPRLVRGDAAFARGNLDGAARYYEEARQLAAAVLAAYPASVDARHELGSALDRLGRNAATRGDAAAARGYWEEMLRTADGGLVMASRHPQWRLMKATAYGKLWSLGGEDTERYLDEMTGLFSELRAEGLLAPREQHVQDFLLAVRKSRGAFQAGDYETARAATANRLAAAEALYPDGLIDAPSLAMEHGSAAWRDLFARAFGEAEAAARRGLAIDPSQLWIDANLAHALMFQGRLAEADAIYAAHGAYVLPQELGGSSWKEAVRNDFDGLRAAGLGHPHMDAVLARLAK